MGEEKLLHLISATVTPALLILGTGTLISAFLARQSVLSGRLRQLHEKALECAEEYQSTQKPHYIQRAQIYMAQARSVYGRACDVKWTLCTLFLAIILLVGTSICLGLSVYVPNMTLPTAISFVLGMTTLLVATILAMRGALRLLMPLQREEEETERLLADLCRTTPQ